MSVCTPFRLRAGWLLACLLCALFGLTGAIAPVHAATCSGSITAQAGQQGFGGNFQPDSISYSVTGSWSDMSSSYLITATVSCVLTYLFPDGHTEVDVVSTGVSSSGNFNPPGSPASQGTVSGTGSFNGHSAAQNLSANHSGASLCQVTYRVTGTVVRGSSYTQVAYSIDNTSSVTETVFF